jgi:hypothetical protein
MYYGNAWWSKAYLVNYIIYLWIYELLTMLTCTLNNCSTFTLSKIPGCVPAVAVWLPQPTAKRAREADHRGAHGGGGQHRQEPGGGAAAPRLLLLRPDAGGATLHRPLHHNPAALHQGAGGGGGGEGFSTLCCNNAEPGRKTTASQVCIG